jgi:hypothetical protein
MNTGHNNGAPRTDYTGTTPPTTVRELEERYRAIHATIDHMGKSLLELIRHPQSEPMQVAQGIQNYFTAYQQFIAARIKLKAAHPDRWLQKKLPWNKEEA